ncbi:hypothetical protein Tco_1233908 [Tanacetum coccineum]
MFIKCGCYSDLAGHSVPTDVFLDSVSHTIFEDRSSKRPRTDSSGIVSSHMTNWQSPVVDTDGHGSATEHVSKVTVSHTSPGRFHQSVHFSYTDSNTTGATTSVSTDPVSNTVATVWILNYLLLIAKEPCLPTVDAEGKSAE